LALVAGDASAQSPVAPARIAIETAPSELRAAVMRIHGYLGLATWSDWRVRSRIPDRRERLAWLAKEFHAPIFRWADSAGEAILETRTPEGDLQVGLLFVHFPTDAARGKAALAVAKVGRNHFLLPILSAFRVRVPGQGLLFVISETSLHPRFQKLIEDLEATLGEYSG
jgi:hypothetical protein